MISFMPVTNPIIRIVQIPFFSQFNTVNPISSKICILSSNPFWPIYGKILSAVYKIFFFLNNVLKVSFVSMVCLLWDIDTNIIFSCLRDKICFDKDYPVFLSVWTLRKRVCKRLWFWSKVLFLETIP